MKRFLSAIKILLVLILVVPITGMSVDAAASSGRCSKVGQTKVSKKVRYVCVKTGSKNIWQIRSSKAKPGSTSVAENTTVKSQTFFAPNVSSDGSVSCEIQERSIHRATYPKGPYGAFPEDQSPASEILECSPMR